MGNAEVHYQIKRTDGKYSEVKKLRTVVKKDFHQEDPIEAMEHFKEIISEYENIDSKNIKVKGYKESR